MKKHTIKMVNKETGREVIYNNVIWVDYFYGCYVLHFEDDIDMFHKDIWEMWDLTPYKVWNGNR